MIKSGMRTYYGSPVTGKTIRPGTGNHGMAFWIKLNWTRRRGLKEASGAIPHLQVLRLTIQPGISTMEVEMARMDRLRRTMDGISPWY